MTVIPWWHPDILRAKQPFLADRRRITAATRRFFTAIGFEEVETPTLQVSPGMEVHLQAFATELRGPHPDDRAVRYLQTSPEFAMKKLLAGGLPRIFQLARAYRNGERSATHQPEFTMLEWYRAGAGYRDLIDDCIGLVRAAAGVAGRSRFQFAGHSCDPFADWEILPVAEAFHRHTGIDVLATAPDPAAPDLDLLAVEGARIGIPAHPGDRWEDLFFRIALERIEPHLGIGRPTVLIDYPLSLAALARPKPEDPRLAERFELYCCAVELANAFGELTDPQAQRSRFEFDMNLKQQIYGERFPIDEDFLAALTFGLPACAGIALGFDRLVMLCAGADTLDQVLWAPVAGSPYRG
ncbi:MAG: EF-P lysine aminoacylase EpmA [Azospirillaceae bacterium]|nr:EF-P lysine aminoacylase EpmA [Azospirillaceae bacterium]